MRGPEAPDVSIVIPVFNRERQVARAIRSCTEPSTALEIEIVVADDGSTDDTAAAARAASSRVRLVQLPRNQGRAAARNAGLRVARGEFVKFLDSDDTLDSRSLASEVEIARTEQADLVVCGWERISEGADGTPVPESSVIHDAPPLPTLPDSLLEGWGVPTSAALYRRTLLAGLEWDGRFPRPDDWLFFIQASLRARRIARSEAPAYRWIDHPGARVTDASLLSTARGHHYVLRWLRHALEERGELTAPRKAQLAQYLYKQLPVLARDDREAFERGVAEILELAPRFVPHRFEPRRSVRWAVRWLGLRRALLARAVARRILRAARSER